MQARHSFRAAVKLSVYMPVALKLDSSDLCAALLVAGVAFRNATFSESKGWMPSGLTVSLDLG